MFGAIFGALLPLARPCARTAGKDDLEMKMRASNASTRKGAGLTQHHHASFTGYVAFHQALFVVSMFLKMGRFTLNRTGEAKRGYGQGAA